jgi:hypothetical protein
LYIYRRKEDIGIWRSDFKYGFSFYFISFYEHLLSRVLKNSLNTFDEEKEMVEVTQAASMPLKRKKRELRSLTNVLNGLKEEKERVKVTDRRSRCP